MTRRSRPKANSITVWAPPVNGRAGWAAGAARATVAPRTCTAAVVVVLSSGETAALVSPAVVVVVAGAAVVVVVGATVVVVVGAAVVVVVVGGNVQPANPTSNCVWPGPGLANSSSAATWPWYTRV